MRLNYKTELFLSQLLATLANLYSNVTQGTNKITHTHCVTITPQRAREYAGRNLQARTQSLSSVGLNVGGLDYLVPFREFLAQKRIELLRAGSLEVEPLARQALSDIGRFQRT